MFKKFLVAGAFALACPAFVFAQDINFLFGGGQNLVDQAQAPPGTGTPGTTSLTIGPGVVGTSGSINVFSTSGFQFDAFDVDVFSSDPNVAQITGGTFFNPTSNIIGDVRFDSAMVTGSADPFFADQTGASGTLFAVNVLNNGVGSPVNAMFDPLFDSTDGFLLATVDFDIVGGGTTEFTFALGDLSIIDLPNVNVGTTATFGSATLTVVDIPEPSSAIVLIFGSVAMIARRKRV